MNVSLRSRQGRSLQMAQRRMAVRRLGSRQRKMGILPMLKLYRVSIIAFCAAQLFTCRAEAYTEVTISSSSPVGLEKQFIAKTTDQFTGILTANPYVPNTYTLKLTGYNVGYSTAVITKPGTYIVEIGTETHTVYQSSAVLSDIYVYGWVANKEEERNDDLGIVSRYALACDSSTWTVTSGTNTYSIDIDPDTCRNVTGFILGEISQKTNGDPIPVVTPPWN